MIWVMSLTGASSPRVEVPPFVLVRELALSVLHWVSPISSMSQPIPAFRGHLAAA